MNELKIFHLKGDVSGDFTLREYMWSMISFYKTSDNELDKNKFNFKV